MENALKFPERLGMPVPLQNLSFEIPCFLIMVNVFVVNVKNSCKDTTFLLIHLHISFFLIIFAPVFTSAVFSAILRPFLSAILHSSVNIKPNREKVKYVTTFLSAF